jgi:hypothetical protein
LNDWVPEHRGNDVKKGTPAVGAWQIIGRRRRGAVVTEEHVHAKARCVALEIEAGQLRASLEYTITQVGDASGNRDADEARASKEHTVCNLREATWHRDVGELGTSSERIGPDTGDAFRNQEVAEAAACESKGINVGDAIGNDKAGEPRALIESVVPDSRDTVGDYDAV